MSTNLNYKQVTNVARRTWDREAYEQKAKARLAQEQEQQASSSSSSSARRHDDNDNQQDDQKKQAAATTTGNEKEEFRPAVPGAAGPEGSKRAFLKARKSAKVEGIDDKVGTTELVSAEAAATTKSLGGDEKIGNDKDVVVKTGIGWHCKVCDCFLKDSHTYLDHINGRKHQRKLGYSMRVERSTKDQVLHKLKLLKQQQEQQQQQEPAVVLEGEPITNYEQVVQAKDRQAQQRKEERQRKRQERKKRLAQEQQETQKGDDDDDEDDDDDDVVEAQVDPAMAAMMGFSNFGGS